MYSSAVNSPLLRSLPLFLLVACASKTAPEGYEAVEPDAEDLSAFDADEPPEPAPDGQAVATEPAPGDAAIAGEAAAEGDGDSPAEGESTADGMASPAPDAKKK